MTFVGRTADVLRRAARPRPTRRRIEPPWDAESEKALETGAHGRVGLSPCIDSRGSRELPLNSPGTLFPILTGPPAAGAGGAVVHEATRM